MSQPGVGNPSIPPPGELDEDLGEFWVGDPWSIVQYHNLSCFERNRLFLNAGDGQFLDASHVSGADDDGDGRAAIAIDIDHDGMLDLLVRQAGGGPLRLYGNRFQRRGHLNVTLRGVRSNRLGVGARITAHVGDRALVREHFPTNTYRSQAPLVTHFGLGDAKRVDRLVIAWPSGATQVIRDVAGDRHIVVTEGSDDILVVTPGTTIPPAPTE